MKGKMADTYSYVSGELRCALFPLFVDGILKNTNKKKCSKWSHQNNFAHFLVSTKPKLLLFSNKARQLKSVKMRLPSIRAIPLYCFGKAAWEFGSHAPTFMHACVPIVNGFSKFVPIFYKCCFEYVSDINFCTKPVYNSSDIYLKFPAH